MCTDNEDSDAPTDREFPEPAPDAAPLRALPGWSIFRSQIIGAGDSEAAAQSEESVSPPRLERETMAPQRGTFVGRAGFAPALELPCEFGRYRLLRLLGEGGMGTVYLAHDLQLRREVALKVPKFASSSNRETLDRFYREARVAATLRHPNLCPIFDVGEHQETPYLTMAYIEGRPLSELVSATAAPLDEREVVRIIGAVAGALQAAHSKGVIHRDLKPGNILLDAQHEPIVTDFGLARSFTRNEERLTEVGGIVGTPEYMSPEQALGEPDAIGPAADIYSLGVILYESLTGKPPFIGGPSAAVIGQMLTKPPPPMSSLRTGINPQLESVCLRALAKEPSARFRSMRDFADALERAFQSPPVEQTPSIELPLRRLSVRAKPVPVVVMARSLKADESSSASSLSETSRWWRVPQWRIFILVVLLATATAGGLVGYTLNRSGVATDPLQTTSTSEANNGPTSNATKTDKVILNRFGSNQVENAAVPTADASTTPIAVSSPASSPVVYRFTNSIGLEFVRIESGEFMMGADDSDLEATADEKPRHKVQITRPFFMGIHEVTVQRYFQVVSASENASRHQLPAPNGQYAWDSDPNPVTNLAWQEAKMFCELLSQKAEEKGLKYRLPTEAEWEYCRRAGTTTRYITGDTLVLTGDPCRANLAEGICCMNQDQLYSLGFVDISSVHRNDFGLCSMAGSLREWCEDWYAPDYYKQFENTAAVDPKGPVKGTVHVARGGSVLDPADKLRSSCRTRAKTDTLFGFRVVCEIK